MENVSVKIVNNKSKKTGKEYECIELTIGRWHTFVFPRSSFEMDYIKEVLADE